MYDLLEKLAGFRSEVRQFCEAEIAPHAVEVDEKQIFKPEIQEKINAKGWWGSIVPKEYGGLGLSSAEYTVLVEEISRVCGSTGLTFAAHNSLGTYPIYAFGTEEQRQKYLPNACKKGALIAFGLTEPEAGSDAGGTKSKAVRDGDHYVINGTKCWITSAEPCTVAIATARTSEEGGVKGISSFILEKGMEGFSVGKKENKMGCRGSNTAYLHFDDLKVHESQRLGDEGVGFKQFMITLDGGRISIGAMALGLAQAAFELASRYATERKSFGQPISSYQAIQWKIADMAMKIEAARHLVYGAAYLKDSGKRMSKESAMAKVYASEVANFCTYEAIQVLGGDGYSAKYPAERYYRDMKLCEIGEGTSEVQRIVIAREVFKSISDM
ncbi:MAG: acyl-CoA dehydrogenase family protein [candidate division Zixibacteria bacterium]|nr:acyl-CoA dehydrogenase family protein [candidate division Zixibacteria bacterium]MBU1470366.1 acyl-CoA dehydrogenase family protein [candidate division Zixibacteria bacterium]MBU2624906.1 acyl-CoA dehydrogenase family protein [candidate division Zixibacteria bacterium]